MWGCRVALVHDWLTGMRGGEKVLEVFAELFPAAPIYTLLHVPGSVSEILESRRIITSPLQRLPRSQQSYRHYLPFFPWFAESLAIEPVDLVLSTSSCVAKGVVPPPGARHACYMLSPMRYLYDRFDDYFRRGQASLAVRSAMRLIRPYLRSWDRRSTERIDRLAAISTFIAERIRSAYGIEAPVIHPPVDVARFAAASRRADDYYLLVSALVPYKRVDVAIEAFRGLDRKLVIAGTGPLYERLRARCPSNVELRGWVDDAEMPFLVAGCRAFLFPNVEDFGIAPVEAMAAGRPVIALRAGGALDTVIGVDFETGASAAARGAAPTGLFFEAPTPEALRAAVRRFENVEHHFVPARITQWAQRFDRACFEKAVTNWLSTALEAVYPWEQAA